VARVGLRRIWTKLQIPALLRPSSGHYGAVDRRPQRGVGRAGGSAGAGIELALEWRDRGLNNTGSELERIDRGNVVRRLPGHYVATAAGGQHGVDQLLSCRDGRDAVLLAGSGEDRLRHKYIGHLVLHNAVECTRIDRAGKRGDRSLGDADSDLERGERGDVL